MPLAMSSFAFNSWASFYKEKAANLPAMTGLPPAKAQQAYLQLWKPSLTPPSVLAVDRDTAVIARTPRGLIALFHHFKWLEAGTSLDNPVETDQLWALCGDAPSPLVLGFDPTTPFGDGVDVKPPDIETIIACDTPDAIRDLKPDPNNPTVTIPAAMTVPPFLFNIMLDSGTQDPAKLAIIVRRALQDFDLINPPPEPDDDSALDLLSPLLYFLWAAASPRLKWAINPAEPATSPHAARWATALLDHLLAPLPPSPTTVIPNATASPGTDPIAAALAALASATPAPKTTGIKGFLLYFQMGILYSSEREFDPSRHHHDPESEPFLGDIRTDPVDTYNAILECPTASVAEIQLQHVLKNQLRAVFYVPPVLATAIRNGQLLRVDDDTPGAFSVFSCSRHPPTDSRDVLKRQIAESHKGLTKEMIDQITKLQHQVPTSGEEFGFFLRHFDAVLQVVLGRLSPARLAVRAWIHHFDRYRPNYDSQARRRTDFWTAVLAHIDHTIQRHLRNCFDAGEQLNPRRINPDILDDLHDSRELILSDTPVPWYVPESLQGLLPRTAQQKHARAPKTDGDDSSVESHKPKNKRRKKPKKLDVQNDAFPQIKPPSPTQINNAFRNNGDCPLKSDNQTMCLRYHLRGTCTSECTRTSSHRPLTGPELKELQDWLNTL